MTNLPPERYDDDPEADREIRQAFALSEGARVAYRDWRQKWVLSLAVANGGALLALFTAMVGDKRPWDLLPCGGLFLIGLTLSGFAPYAVTRALFYQESHYWGYAQHRLDPTYCVTVENVDYTGEGYVILTRNRLRFWDKCASVVAMLSGGAFALGGALGLVLLTLKLFRIT